MDPFFLFWSIKIWSHRRDFSSQRQTYRKYARNGNGATVLSHLLLIIYSILNKCAKKCGTSFAAW
jgi:hypothetical protein